MMNNISLRWSFLFYATMWLLISRTSGAARNNKPQRGGLLIIKTKQPNKSSAGATY